MEPLSSPETHASTEGAGHKGAFPPFQSQTYASQVLWLVLTFGFLYLVIARLITPRLEKILRNRHQQIEGRVEEARQLSAQAESAAQAYETQLSAARERAKVIAEDKRLSLAQDGEARRKSLQAELGEKLANAERSIAARKAEALTHVNAIAQDAAQAIIERLTGQPLSPSVLSSAFQASKQV